ncbi:helicase ARIP4 isoform X2 [Octopus vulgaris]|uniref:Helicase ARIP4 isoform X2 n=1 Tax=Octopus vulgaris TaxID=6645 RepID=A0AA36ARB3_OCTVU|nr:helicase ARIP4 isoform X2 [Octopus vulgaris]
METSVDNISSCNASANQLNDQMAEADYLDTLIAAVTSHKEDTQENDNLTDIQNEVNFDSEKTEDKNIEENLIGNDKMDPSSPQAHSEQSEERNDDDEEEEVKKEEPNTDGNKKKKKHKRKRAKKVENDDDESDSDIVESKQSKIEMEDIKDIKEESDVSFTPKDENEIKNESPSSSEDNAGSESSNSSDSDSSSSNSSSNEDGDSSSSSGDDDDEDGENDDDDDADADDDDEDDDDGKDNEEEETQKDTEKVKSKEKSSRSKGRKKKKSDSNDEEKPKASSRKRKLTLKRQRKKEKEKTKRRNIRSILRDDQLEAETLAAQNEEMERQRRLQELKKQMQQKVIKPEEKDSQLKSLLQGDCSSAAFYLGTDQLGTEETNKQFSKDDVILLDSGDENKKKVLTDIIELSDDDDVVMIKSDEEPEEAEEEEEEEDMDNVGTHINDELNQPDETGNVLINIGHPEGDPDVFLPPHIADVIKPHQIGGIRFLYDNVIESQSRFKSSSGFGCILAHSMGLGKTIQLIGFIDIFLRFTEAQSVLCIVPINTIQNWLAEFNMWLPEKSPEDSEDKANLDVTTRNFKLFVINDNHKTTLARAKILDEWSRIGGVLLMGYEMYRLLVTKKCTFGPPPSRRKKKNNEPIIIDIEEEDMNKKLHLGIQKALVNPGPDLIVCDEGHRIKNSLSGVAQSLKNIKTKRRIVLTGYPLQNNLLEYWCMVDFVRPNYLGTKAEFCNMFERPIMNGQCVDSTREDVTLMRYRAHVLHSLLQGFIQRRGHSVLQFSLPPKQEHVFTIRMSNIQRQLYKKFMDCISDCEMGMWASYNPLKAFSTCCKIWNHPDVMWKIIQHQKTLLEDNDLDFEPDGKVNGVQSGGKKKNKTIGNSTRMNANTKKKILPEPINMKNNAHKCCSNNRSNTSDNLNLGFQPKGMGMNSCSGSRDNSCCNYNLGQDLGLCCNSGMQSCNSPGMNNTPSGNNTCNDNSLEQNMNFMSSKMSNMKDNNNQLSASYLSSTCHKDSNSGISTINQGCHINNEPRGDMVRNLEPGECMTRNESSQNNCINNDHMIPGSHIGMNASCDQTNTRHLMDSGSMNSENHIGSLGYLNTHSNSDAHGCLNASRHNDVNNVMNANDQMNLNYGLNSGSHMSGNSMNMVSRDVINSNCAIGDSSNLNSCPPSGLNFGNQSHCYDATNSNHNMGLSSLKSCAANTNNHLGGGSSMNYMSHLGPNITAGCSLTNDTMKNINIDSCEQITDIKSNVTCQMNNMNINPCQMNSDNQSHLNSNNTLGMGNMLLSNTNQNNQESKDDYSRDIGSHITPNTGLNSCSNNTQLNTTAKDCKNVNMCNKVSQNMNMQSTNMFGGSNSTAGAHVCNQSGTQGNIPTTTSTTEKKLDSNVLSLDWVAEIMKDYTPELLENGGKMVLLFSLIEESLKVSDKMLVFSQSLTTLNVIEDFLNRRQVPRPEMNENWCKNKSYFRLDGSTSAAEREKLINQFNSPDNNRVWLFLLSTRAGCLGINLIGANRVVIFDASWNPCHDCQAVCRVYRYGQQKHSYIYRLITDNTLEKKIYDRQINKQGMSDRVVDELNPENQFTRQQVDSLLHYVDQDLPEVKLDNFDSEGDSVLQTVLEKDGKWLTKEPFTHESLLLDQKSLRLTKKEKQLAKQGYVMEKKMNLNYSRQSYTMYYPKPGQSTQYYQGPGPWPNNMQAGERPVASVKPIISTPVPMSLPQVNFPLNQMLRSTVSGQQVKVVRPGVSVHQIVTTTDIMLPGSNNNSSYPDVIPAGQQIHVIKTPRGVYIRTNKGKIFAVRSKPPATSTTTSQTPPTSLSDLLLPPALPATSTSTSSGNLSNIGVSSSNLGSNNNAPGKNSLSFLESRPNNQIINSNNTEASNSSNYPDYLNYLRSLKPQFQSGYFPKALSSRNSNVGNSNFNSMLPQHMIQSPSSQQLSHFPVDSQASDRNKSFPSSTHQLGSHSLSLPATSLQKQMSLQKDNDICIISDDEGKMDNESEGIINAPTTLNLSSSSTDNCSNTDITNKSSSSFIHSPALDLPAMIDNIPLQTTTNTSNINLSSQSPYNSDSYVRSSPKLAQVVEMGNSASNNSCTVDPQQIGSNDFSTHSLLPTFSSIPQSENHHQHQGHRQPQISPIPVSNSGLSSASNLNMSSSNFSPSLPNLQQQSLYNIPNYSFGNMLSPHMLTNKKSGQSPIENSGYNPLPTFSPSIMNQAPINNNNNSNNNNNNPDNLNPRTNTSEPSLSHSQTLSSLL